MNNRLQITNTLSGKKEFFVPLNPNIVKMYVCGITPYDRAHVGHGRVYVTFDVLFRLLNFLGYKVYYCRNFTDIDDKLLNKSLEEFKDKSHYKEIAERYIKSFSSDMKLLKCKVPTFEPRVTESINDIIRFIDGLIIKKFAYVVDGNVYYEVNKFPEYAKLSKRKLDELKSGARVDIDERKKDPLDFALWKKEPTGTFWESPWSWGRPGWHIECSALAEKFLGKYIDIHGGGMDLIFPHHENEIAQSEALFGPPFAKYWMHNAFVKIDKQKMSKSLGNFFTLEDVFLKIDPMILRFYYLNHNYNIPIDFSFDELKRVKKSYQKLCKIFEFVTDKELTQHEIKKSDLVNNLLLYICDDLNIAGMFGNFYENLTTLQKDPKELAIVKAFIKQILGLDLIPSLEKTVQITPNIQKLIDERQKAREERDFKRSDEIREELKKLGIEVQDKISK